ncbi:MAG: four helix bundle protein [Deltaproteobacteria bacterium]|nr:four helix bundle protein [Deltaproteobacteria bacterium]
MRDHTKLRAFELADEVALLVYRAHREFPEEEVYGLTSQMRRAAISVPSKIVEGYARESQAEYFRFYTKAGCITLILAGSHQEAGPKI